MCFTDITQLEFYRQDAFRHDLFISQVLPSYHGGMYDCALVVDAFSDIKVWLSAAQDTPAKAFVETS